MGYYKSHRSKNRGCKLFESSTQADLASGPKDSELDKRNKHPIHLPGHDAVTELPTRQEHETLNQERSI
uniref:Small, acid-soluble spore protein N n=1 Tax=Loa loa TaxID=7209 RepID=A0A1I7VFM1_LOALO